MGRVASALRPWRMLAGPGVGASGGSPTSAGGTFLAVKYPGALDTVPTIADDATVLSGQWHNFLTLLIEAIEAEIGTFPANMKRRNEAIASYQALLGTDAKPALSEIVQSKLYGVVIFSITKAASAYATEVAQHVTIPHDYSLFRTFWNREPVIFAMANEPGPGNVTAIVQGPTIVRGWASPGSLSNQVQVRYRGANAQWSGASPGPGAPTGSTSVTIDFLIFFMPHA